MSCISSFESSTEAAKLERTDKFFLRRFIRGCKYDVEKAFNKLLAYEGNKVGTNFAQLTFK